MHASHGSSWPTGVLHAGLAATSYVLVREWGFVPWLWPLDDGLWALAAIIIAVGWRFWFRSEDPVTRGAIIGTIASVITAVALLALFEIGFRILAHRGLGLGGPILRALSDWGS